VALSLLHLARWLAWQLGEPEQPEAERPANITVFLSTARHSSEISDA
jgi:hypothetical protein